MIIKKINFYNKIFNRRVDFAPQATIKKEKIKALTSGVVFGNIFERSHDGSAEKNLENSIQHYTRTQVCEEEPGQTKSRNVRLVC